MNLTIISYLLILATHSTMEAPSSGGQLDLQSKWWTGTIGGSGNYLTEDFRKSVFIPVMKNIVNNLDKIRQQQDSMESADNWMGIAIAAAVTMNTLALIYLHRKNSEK